MSLRIRTLHWKLNLSQLKDYDSLALMSIIAFVDEKFKMKLTAIQLRELRDFKSLISIIGIDKFEND